MKREDIEVVLSTALPLYILPVSIDLYSHFSAFMLLEAASSFSASQTQNNHTEIVLIEQC